jgi:signal transduction histidine kinase
MDSAGGAGTAYSSAASGYFSGGALRSGSSLRRSNIIVRMLIALAAALVVTLSGIASKAEPAPRTVLILDGSDSLIPGYAEISKAFRSALTAKSNARIYVMTLDLTNFSNARYQLMLRNFVKEKYRDVPIDVVLAVGSLALEFAMQLQTEDWPGAPIVFAGASAPAVARLVEASTAPKVTGKTLELSLVKSVETARMLVPRLKEMVVVGDPLENQPFRTHFKTELMQMAPDVALIDLTGLPLADVKKRISTLSKHAAILYTALTSDGAGKTFLPHEGIEPIAEAANRPIVVDVDNRIGVGGTGGAVVRPTLLGEEAAQLVLRILSGENAARIPIGPSEALKPVFDWRELKRWGVTEARLPPGSELRFYQPTAWEQYRIQYILVGITLLFQTGLIGALLYADRRRRSAEMRSLELSTELAHVNRVATAGELAASIAHEIRQPLSAIVARGSAGLNWLKRATPELDKVRGALENIVENGHRADQVLKNTRAMFGKGDAAQSTVNVNKVIDEVLALVSGKMTEQGIRVTTRYADKPVPLVRINRVELQQVLLNLTMNAIEAMSTTQGEDRSLELTTEVSPAGRVLISVRDSGPGIASDQLALVFKSFFSTKPGGMGVGLSVCKTIVEAHGGRLTAAHGEPRGMIFTIDLPLRQRRQHTAAGQQPASVHAEPPSR